VMNIPRSSVLAGTARRLACRGWMWLRDPEGRREERAATSLVVFIMFFPLIVGAFGFGIDIAKNIWIRTSIQNAVDTSAVAGAAVTDSSTGVLRIRGDGPGSPGAQSEMHKLYASNRADNPGLTCLSGPFCWQEQSVVTATTTQFNVQEQSKNAFLGFLGPNLRIQNYSLQGKAKISLSTR
jgi:hypothetical protein